MDGSSVCKQRSVWNDALQRQLQIFVFGMTKIALVTCYPSIHLSFKIGHSQWLFRGDSTWLFEDRFLNPYDRECRCLLPSTSRKREREGEKDREKEGPQLRLSCLLLAQAATSSISRTGWGWGWGMALKSRIKFWDGPVWNNKRSGKITHNSRYINVSFYKTTDDSSPLHAKSVSKILLSDRQTSNVFVN